MARYLGPICKKARRFGFDSGGLKGVAIEGKCKLTVPPGQHGSKKPRESDYRKQLINKQILKFTYKVLEKQFRLYFEKASRKKGATGEVLLQMLESRLDNVVYRMGFAVTRAESGQLVSHGAVLVNNKRVTIRSYQVQPGDVVSIREKSKNQTRIQDSMELYKNRNFLTEWLALDHDSVQGVFKRYPDRSELPSDFNEQLVVELYSK
jgi:small subunit ribosomal protein S4